MTLLALFVRLTYLYTNNIFFTFINYSSTNMRYHVKIINFKQKYRISEQIETKARECNINCILHPY